MALAAYVDRAMQGKCAICGRRLPKRHIPLYSAQVNTWKRGDLQTDSQTVEVAVCNQKCMDKYQNV